MNLQKGILVMASLAAMTSCDNYRTNVTENGLKYRIFESHEGARKPKIGELVTLNLVLKNSKDSVLRDTYKEGRPFQIMLQTPPFKGSFEEGLAMLAKEDSAAFYVSADSLFSKMGQPLPPELPKGSDITFTVKILDIQNEQEYKKASELSRASQGKVDAKIIDDYVAKNGLKTTETPSGLNYLVVKEGTGDKPAAGDIVSVQYAGRLLNGKEFDKSTSPVDFPIGVGQVIPGWEEGIMNMRKGGKSTFIIPSSIGYGEQGSPGAIPPNSVLVFDVELVNIKKGKK
jgi:FKBP-type peptidyl-prolyl cis-trans isomerase FkpA